LFQNNKAEVTTEDAVSVLRKAAKWAQLGLVVSTGPPVDMTSLESNASDKKKTGADVVCKEKNIELNRYVHQ
jgi:E3 ubiquitin-protein ligase HECTD4